MGILGFLSDAHGNKQAFDIGIEKLAAMGASEIYYLGDAVGYIPSLGVVESIKALKTMIHCLKGNHEKMFLTGDFDHEADSVYQIKKIISPDNLNFCHFIESWRDSIDLTVGNSRLLMVHGSPLDFHNGYVYPDSDLRVYGEKYDFVFMGHTHRPFVRTQGRTCFVNVGSCGLPRDDARYGSAVTFDTESLLPRLLRFDISNTFERIEELFPDIHPLVKKLFKRRDTNIVGEIV
jgi:putative phosphoesterase